MLVIKLYTNSKAKHKNAKQYIFDCVMVMVKVITSLSEIHFFLYFIIIVRQNTEYFRNPETKLSKICIFYKKFKI